MKFKISLLAALLVAAFPFAAKADDTNSYESLKVSCASGAECGDFGVNFQEEELRSLKPEELELVALAAVAAILNTMLARLSVHFSPMTV